MQTATHTLLGGKVTLAQPVNGYRAGMDAVMLAASVPAAQEDRVIDVGCGAGAVACCIAARTAAHVTALDKNPEMVALARANADANDLTHFDALHGNIGDKLPDLRQKFNHVATNPPYGEQGANTPSALEQKAWSNLESDVELKAWLQGCFVLLKPKGTLTLIHRADRIDDILRALHYDFGGVTLFPLFPYAGAPAKRVIVRAAKQSRNGAVILPGLIMHDSGGALTGAANAILRDGAALF